MSEYRPLWSVWMLLLLLGAVAPAWPADDEALDCIIEPYMQVDLRSRIVEGIIDQVLVDIGDRVDQGQVVARLESSVEQAAVDYARARASQVGEVRTREVELAFGERKAGRLAQLYSRKAVADNDRDEAETEAKRARYQLLRAKENRNLARLELRRARATLQRHVIHSTIPGVVTERYLNPGESVENQAIVRVAQIDPLRVVVVVPVARLGRIRAGQEATVYPEDPVGGEYHATVSIVDPVVDAASGTFRVRLRLPNPDYRLPSGLRCKVSLGELPPAPVQARAAPPPVESPGRAAPVPAPETPPTPPASSVNPQPSPSKERLASLDPPATTREPPPRRARETCYSIGPLHSRERLRALRRAIEPLASRLAERETHSASRPRGYLILTTQRYSPAQAEAFAQRLRDEKVRDFQVLKRGPLSAYVSLGYYATARSAKQRLADLAAHGIQARIRPQYAGSATLWLDLTARADEATRASLQGLSERYGATLSAGNPPCRGQTKVSSPALPVEARVTALP